MTSSELGFTDGGDDTWKVFNSCFNNIPWSSFEFHQLVYSYAFVFILCVCCRL